MANNSDYEVITGLSLADGSVTPQVVYLQVDASKECKVILPNNTVLTSTAGVINDTWTGAAGSVTLIVDKTSSIVYFGDYDDASTIISDYIGDLYTIFNGVIYCNGCTSLTSISALNATELACAICTSLTSISALNATELACNLCPYLTSISAPNATYLYCAICPSLTSISAPNATELYCSVCALTSVAIAAQLAATVANISDLSTIYFDFSGGTNAAYSTWSAQAQADAQTIITAGGTVSYNS